MTKLEERAGVREQLNLQIAAIQRDAPAPRASAVEVVRETAPEPFGRWLLAQQDRGDWIDDLALAARTDRGFPKNGTPDEVRRRLQELGSDGDAFEQVDDAERCWVSL